MNIVIILALVLTCTVFAELPPALKPHAGRYDRDRAALICIGSCIGSGLAD